MDRYRGMELEDAFGLNRKGKEIEDRYRREIREGCGGEGDRGWGTL